MQKPNMWNRQQLLIYSSVIELTQFKLQLIQTVGLTSHAIIIIFLITTYQKKFCVYIQGRCVPSINAQRLSNTLIYI